MFRLRLSNIINLNWLIPYPSISLLLNSPCFWPWLSINFLLPLSESMTSRTYYINFLFIIKHLVFLDKKIISSRLLDDSGRWETVDSVRNIWNPHHVTMCSNIAFEACVDSSIISSCNHADVSEFCYSFVFLARF